MEELSIEEKARRYDEAIKVAKRNYETIVQMDNDCTFAKEGIVNTFHHIFPELTELEDSRIKDIIKKSLRVYFEGNLAIGTNDTDYAECLAWLEKQGEQKPTDKVEPKFHKGDWVFIEEVRGYKNGPFQIKTVDSFGYSFDEYHTIPFMYEELLSKWTIQDAKDGDVLTDGNLPFIFKKIDTSKYSYAYCGISVDSGFKIESEGESGEWTWMQDIKPATKEQRDTLMKAMTDAGYTFNFEKKELKKIEQKPTDNKGMNIDEESMTPFQKEVFCIIDTTIEEEQGLKQVCDKLLALASNEIKQKPAWSEEDEEMLNQVIEDIVKLAGPYVCYHKDVDWLKSLKERVQTKQEWKQENIGDLTDFEIVMMHIGDSFFGENAGLDPNDTNAIKEQANILLGLVPKQEWSEEDEVMIKVFDSIIRYIVEVVDKDALERFGTKREKLFSWLKSIKDRAGCKVNCTTTKKWSKEDDYAIERLFCLLDNEQDNYPQLSCDFQEIQEIKELLKSLRPQNWSKEDKERYISCLQRLSTGNPAQPETINSKWFKEHVYPQNTWKPSDAQMASITCAVRKMKESACYDSELVSLFNDLKKLRDE